MTKYTFSGHETFYCRHYWLKKGVDYVIQGNNFSSPDAVTKLGVGKNMVTSIRFWLKSFGILSHDKNNITFIGNYLFSEENGKDPYLEDINSLWLLHYLLISEKAASLYALFFLKLRLGEKEFTDEKVKDLLNRHLKKEAIALPNEKSLTADVKVLRSNYLPPTNSKNVEDDFSGLLQDLGIIKPLGTKKYIIENQQRKNLSTEILVYSIIDLYENTLASQDHNRGDFSISINQLLSDEQYNVAKIFCLNEQGLLDKIQELQNDSFYNGKITYSENAGIRELQIIKDLKKEDILNKYYNGVK
ncbi:DUF4007 family protein [Halosquirtibacter laminarini]|uniref:DUF4007 family protein n=1 Tax=Halosquirtibacter laminarini TaxID=3374600 RepID=A0AC61NPU4_9BACT|nr:DUF4007 family protein [Prolixibacteraceae bacterium]